MSVDKNANQKNGSKKSVLQQHLFGFTFISLTAYINFIAFEYNILVQYQLLNRKTFYNGCLSMYVTHWVTSIAVASLHTLSTFAKWTIDFSPTEIGFWLFVLLYLEIIWSTNMAKFIIEIDLIR